MRVSISYPPLESSKGVPLLSQNRQFQWFSSPTYIYPMVPSYAATLLARDGFDALWDDGIAEQLSYEAWRTRFFRSNPDVVLFESKTPVIKRHWRIIDELKAHSPDLITVLAGDHCTAFPRESLESCGVDYVLKGGDFDVGIRDLCRYLEAKARGVVAELPVGIWCRDKGGTAEDRGDLHLSTPLDELPLIDRDLTHWRLYSEHNGNYKYRPGTYTMAGRDCWWGRCKFCSWTTLFPGAAFRAVSPERLLDEVGMLIDRYAVREIFDDSGCFPQGAWLRRFCEEAIARGYHNEVRFGCNMRVGALSQADWELMARANFRFVLIGVESVNEHTLERLGKGIKVSDIEPTFRMAAAAGLEPHATIMTGYPWEDLQDAEATVELARRLFQQGYIHSLQATIVVPYPGTPMFDEARREGWLLTEDWDRYDMRETVWRSPVTTDDMLRLTRKLYRAALSPRFLVRRVASIRSADDLRFFVRAGRKLLGHLVDFAS